MARYQKYDLLKESGQRWLGLIPQHWNTSYSKWLFKERNAKAEISDEMLTASQKYGVIPQKLFMELEQQKVVQVQTGHDILKQVKNNDFVISMRSFQGGIEYCGYSGAISSAYVPLEPQESISLGYYKYLFKSKQYIQALQSTTNLVRDGQALRYSNFLQVRLPVLPVDEANKIAAFLDYETARIDQLIAKQQRLIELLKEKRQAVISHAVTKGLNPNAPMKDSGVEWLGQVPEHWIVTKVGLNTVKIGSGKTPKGGADVYQESGVIFIRSQNVYDDGLRISETECCYITEETHNDMISTLVRPKDVLLNITGGSIGRSCLVPDGIGKANVNQHVCILRFKVGLPRYMAFFMTSDCIQEQISVLQVGGNREGLNFEQISNMKICIPPADEVSEICNYLESYRFKNECLMLKASSLIELLKERRNSVISAAVTGKIDLRGWRPPVKDAAA